MKPIAAGLLLLCALVGAKADHYEDGLRQLEVKSFAKAAESFRLAAAAGSASAERQLGFMYYKGLGRQQSDTHAVTWFERAAAHGDLQSQVNLGQMFENGMSVAQSDSRSAYWYQLAAEQGHRSSQFRLGEIYYLGTGVPKNNVEAVKWWQLAMRPQDQRASEMLAMIEATLRRLSPEAREDGQRLADEWLAIRATSSMGGTGNKR